LPKTFVLCGMSSTAANVVFKDYSPNQILLLPPSLEELIIENHPVKVVNSVIEQIDLKPLLAKFKGGGTSSYHPKMLLKVMVYAYLNNIYSSRKIEEALQQNIYFMWLSGMNKPDHNTINRFRNERLKDVLKPIFSQIVVLLAGEGLLSLKELYLDGTKIEANANRYTFVWGKAIKTSKERIQKQIDELWKYAQEVAAQELADETPVSFEQIDAQKVKQAINCIDEVLKDKPIDKKVRQKLNYAKKNWPAKLEAYAEMEKTIGTKRSSCSKTDLDATFMRMKEDHMKNGQLKPAYNLQVSSNNQFITNYSIHQQTTDTGTMIAHLTEHKDLYQRTPAAVTTDAGYGSEENYTYLQKEDITSFVKYSYFHLDQKKAKDVFHPESLHYNAGEDYLVCPSGQRMQNIGTRKDTTSTGFEQTYTLYQAENCAGCPLRTQCHKAEGNRVVRVNHNLRKLKEQTRQNLLSEEGIRHRKKRPWDVEPIFAQIKHNKNFKRFMLRGKAKVEIEAGLIAIAHNLAKKVAA
jgi:transposase